MKPAIFRSLAAASIIIIMLILFSPLQESAEAITSSSQAGRINTVSSALNIRSAADSGSAILSSAKKGSYITLISKQGSWWKVEYAPGKYGYAYANYIGVVSQASIATTKVSDGYLNVRYGPGTQYTIKSSLYNGQSVIILSGNNGWSNVLYNGTQTGYVNSQYLNLETVWPVPASSRINQYYACGSHLGIDIAPATQGVPGNSVLSMLPGKVVYAGWLGDYGYVIYINSYYQGKYIQTRYAHLQKAPFYATGDTVIAGQTIGALGNTGKTSGVHLHFEVRIRNNSGNCIANSDSTPVNPLNYVNN